MSVHFGIEQCMSVHQCLSNKHCITEVCSVDITTDNRYLCTHKHMQIKYTSTWCLGFYIPAELLMGTGAAGGGGGGGEQNAAEGTASVC